MGGFLKKIGGGLKDVFTTEGPSFGEELTNTLRGVRNVFSPSSIKYILGLSDKNPFAPNALDISDVSSPDEARRRIDLLLGVDTEARTQAEAIDWFKNQGGFSKLVTVLGGNRPDSLMGMPFTPDGDAFAATGNFPRDPVFMLDLRFNDFLQANPSLATQYLRETDPEQLLPDLVVSIRDMRNGNGNEQSNNFLDMLGRPFAASKDIFVSLLFGTAVDRVEEVLGDGFYQNSIPDPYLRQVMAKRLFDYNVFEFWDQDHEKEREAIKFTEGLIAREGVGSPAAAEEFEQYLKDNSLGAAGIFSDIFGKILWDPLWLIPAAGIPLKFAAGGLRGVRAARGAGAARETIASALSGPGQALFPGLRVGGVSRIVTPAGRSIAFSDRSITDFFKFTGVRALMNMPELSYQQAKLAHPAKGLTKLFFERTPTLQGHAARATVELRLSRVASELAQNPNLINELGQTLLIGKPTKWVEENLPGFLDNPVIAQLSGASREAKTDVFEKVFESFTKWTDDLVESGRIKPRLVEDEVQALIRDGAEIIPPSEMRQILLGNLSHAAQTFAEQGMQELWEQTTTGRLLNKYYFPVAGAVRAATAAITINNPGFVFLNLISNGVRLMWHSAWHPLQGSQAISRSLMLETGTILKGGGRYPEVWEKMLRGVGMTPIDVERSISRMTGIHDLIGTSLQKLDDPKLVDDSFELMRKAILQPAKEIGSRFRFSDAFMYPVYVASRVDKAYRRAFFMSNLQKQYNLGTESGGAFFGLFGPMRNALKEQGLADDQVDLIGQGFSDEIRAYLFGTRDLPEGVEVLNQRAIRQILEERILKVDAGDLSTMITSSEIADAFAKTRLGLDDVQGRALAVTDLSEFNDFGTHQILPMLDQAQKAQTPEAFEQVFNAARRMARQKGMEYDLEARISRQLSNIPHVSRTQLSDYAKSVNLTNEAIRQDMSDALHHLDRLMGVTLGEAWSSKKPPVWEAARKMTGLAEEAITENVRRLEVINRVYNELGSETLDAVGQRTFIPKSMLDRLGVPDDLRIGVAAVTDRPPTLEGIAAQDVISQGPTGRAVLDNERSLSDVFDILRRDQAFHEERFAQRTGLESVSSRREASLQKARTKWIQRISDLRVEGQSEGAILDTLLAELDKGNTLFTSTTHGELKGISDDVLARRAGRDSIIGEQVDISAELEVVEDFISQWEEFPTGTLAGAAPTLPPTALPAPTQLPSDLRGARPRFNIGRTSFEPAFESDVDKALFIVAQERKSRRDDDFLAFLQEIFPEMSASEIREAGRTVRQQIKILAQAQGTEGPLPIPNLSGDLIERLGIRTAPEVTQPLATGSVLRRELDEIEVRLQQVESDLAAANSAGATPGEIAIKTHERDDLLARANKIRDEAVDTGQTIPEGGLLPEEAPPPPPPPPPAGEEGITVGQLHENYFNRRDRTWDDLYGFIEETVGASAQPNLRIAQDLRKLSDQTFRRHRAILQRALEQGDNEAWGQASMEVRSLYENMAATRGTTAGWGPNDRPQAMQGTSGGFDTAGVLAREVQEYAEFYVDYLAEQTDLLLRGERVIEPATTRALRDAADTAAASWPGVRDTMVANAKMATDFGMLNYLDQTGGDRIFQAVFPFEFWPTRDAFNWAIRGANAPGAFGALMVMMFNTDTIAEQYGFPKRLEHRIPIPLPGLAEFTRKLPVIGGMLEDGNFAPTYFVDPMRFVFPYTFLREGFDQDEKRNTPGGRILDFFQNSTPLNAGPFQTFIGRQTGILDKDAWRSNYLSGGPFGLPTTALARATARFVFGGDETAIPEEQQDLFQSKGFFAADFLRDILGMNPDRWSIYRSERALASLVADGELIPGATTEEQLEKAWIAIDSHAGPEWRKAVKSAQSEKNLQRLTHWIGFPFGDLVGVNEGEMIWFGLKGIFAEASRKGQIGEFFEKFPEFELRSAAVRGLSDPDEQAAAIDTELYYRSLETFVNEPFQRQIMDMENERDRLRNMDQLEPVRNQIEVIEEELRVLRDQQEVRRGILDRAYPFRETELSINRSPRERALRLVRGEWFDIDRAEGEPFEAFLTRRETFLSQFPSVTDRLATELDWHALEILAIRTKLIAGRQRDKAFANNEFEKAQRIADERDAQLEEIHNEARTLINRQDVERYLGSFGEVKTAAEKEFDNADALFDFWMSLVGDGTLFSSRERASISAYFRSQPEIQKYFPLSAVDLDDLTTEQRLAIMRRRDFWRTFHGIRDSNVRLDYLRLMKPEVDRANALLGLPPIEILDIDPYPAEAGGDPLFDHISMMAAIHRQDEIDGDESLSDDERRALGQLSGRVGFNATETSLTDDDILRYITPYTIEETATP